ncbi:MAG TPA: ABC transporter permease [Gemmatimonadaceae bacterium]|nr:ABC transporter permease [Gemmatimonadaceae bacterium]
MQSLLKDVTYAWRTLRANPAFSLTAIITIALGIGASTAIFSVVNAVLLRPLPYGDAGRLTLIWGDMVKRDVKDFPFPPGDLPDLRQQGTLFQEMAGVATFRQPLVGDGGEPEQVTVAGVTENIFSVLRARILLGRNFNEADATPLPPPPQAAPGAPPPAPAVGPDGQPPLVASWVLSYGFWQRRYGGDRNVIGKMVDVPNGRAEIVGVLAPEFELLFPPSTDVERNPDIYAALRINYATASRTNVFLRMIGRLKPGVTLPQAQQQLDNIAADLRRRFPIKETAGLHLRAEWMRDDLVADVRPAIIALMGAVSFVLLIACANVANLMLVRAASRERELAVRSALGGTRWGLMRQMLTESMLVATLGALVGFGLAQAGIKLLLVLAPENLPRLDSVSADPMVLVFTVLAGVVSAAAFGIVPALRASRPDLADILRSAGRTGGLARGRRIRNAVVTAEVALSFVLLIGCGLMLRSFIALQHVDPGYDPKGLLTFFALSGRPGGPDVQAGIIRQLAERLRSIPGVTGVTAASPLPLDGGLGNARWGTEAAVTDPSKFQQANVHVILPGYFKVMRSKLIEGRDFTEADNNPNAVLAIIDRNFAAKAFPGQSAVGKRLYVRVRSNDPEWFEVIGVVDRERHETLAADGREAMFLTDGLFGHGAVARWAVRTNGDPNALVPAVRAAIREVDRQMPVSEVQPMTAFVDRAMASTRFALALIATFAAIAAVLAAVGLYGVLSTVVRQRTAEIGVRMAFGANTSSIFQLVIGHGLRLSAIGIALGAAGALALTRGMKTMLVGVRPTDPLTFVAIGVLFMAVAAVSSWIPARRAAGLDPNVALRDE